MDLSPESDMSVDNILTSANLDNETTPPNFVNRRHRGRNIAEPLDNSLLPPSNDTTHGNNDAVHDVTAHHGDFQNFQDCMLELLDNWCKKQDMKINKISQDFEELKTSVMFVTNKYDEINEKIENTNQTVTLLESKVQSFDTHIQRIDALESKLESLEQQARQSNLEIGNIPERRSENLIILLEDLGTAIKHSISKNDIAAVHRVPHANSLSVHPKNIIVKFHSRIQRDNVLAAFRLVKGVTTSQLNISGEPRKVYLNEHLTLHNKKLFRLSRETAKTQNYRYVWIKHGTILVRENETTPVIAIRSASDISKIIPKST